MRMGSRLGLAVAVAITTAALPVLAQEGSSGKTGQGGMMTGEGMMDQGDMAGMMGMMQAMTTMMQACTNMMQAQTGQHQPTAPAPDQQGG